MDNDGVRETFMQVRRAFVEFAAIPTWMVLGFLLLAVGSYLLDRLPITWLDPLRQVMRQHVFANAQSTSDLLGVIATSLITVTSITFSLLLLAAQQSAASLTSQVLDQYLRRRFNQVVFGFFVGLALYSLIVLSTVDAPFNPVIGATISLVLMGAALALLPILLYSTLDQMRPAEIIESIHDHTLRARHHQLSLLRRTRRAPTHPDIPKMQVRATADGFVTALDIDAIASVASKASKQAEVILHIAIGSYIAYQDIVAEISVATTEMHAEAEQTILHAITLDRQRDLNADPAYGIQQLETIAWTSISTSKQNPAPGMLVIQRLRDLLARWSTEESPAITELNDHVLPIVYRDSVLDQLMDSFEALAIVSTESMQHQIFAEIARSFAIMLDRLPTHLQDRCVDVTNRALAGLGDHILAAELDSALSSLSHALITVGKNDAAAVIITAQSQLKATVGHLNSRSTRVKMAR
jgi:uncharacterized membrane protein